MRDLSILKDYTMDPTNPAKTCITYSDYYPKFDVDECVTLFYYYFHDFLKEEIDPDDRSLNNRLKSISNKLETTDEGKVINYNLVINNHKVKLSVYWEESTRSIRNMYKIPKSEYVVVLTIDVK